MQTLFSYSTHAAKYGLVNVLNIWYCGIATGTSRFVVLSNVVKQVSSTLATQLSMPSRD